MDLYYYIIMFTYELIFKIIYVCINIFIIYKNVPIKK